KVSIRLYSKSVEHDEGGRLKLMGGSQGVNAQNVYYADRIDEIDFFLYAGRYDDKRLSIENSGDLDRNKYKKRLIGSIGTDNHHLEFQALEQKSDTFLGPAIAGTPLKAKGELNYFDLGWSSRFLDQSLIANVAYSRGAYTMNSAYDQEIIPNTQITAFDQEHIDEVLSVQVKKIVNLDDHKLTIGAEYRNKSFALESLAFNGVSRPITQTYDAQQILAFFLQDDYTLDENKLLTLSMMYQAYDNNAPEIKDHTTHQIRAGYIYTSHEWVSKTFIASQEFAPEPYMLSKSFQGNSNLDTMKSLYAMQEFIVDVNRASLHVIFGYVENSDIIIKSNAMTDNAQNTSYVNTQAIELKQTFLEDDTLDVNLFRSEHSSAINDDRELIYGITLRMLNSIDAFDFFNELVILEGYSEGTGYDYSLGARYHASDDLTFSIKGENVFDTGLEWSYISQMPPNKETVKASAIEQRFWAGLEFLF
ncbi:MAG: hypothetical protein U9N52_08785, partial [Campylobacterota bacterium]|nr:hypothetical protein [Campylobacterota bacterium]